MKESLESPDNDYLITFYDLVRIAKKNARKIRIGAIIAAVLAIFYGLTKPIEYEAEATFKEKGKSSGGLGGSLSAAFSMLSEGQTDSDAFTMMRSRSLLEQLVKEQGLQAVIAKNEYTFPLIPFQTIKNNLLIEYALLAKPLIPVLDDSDDDLKINEIAYNGEIPLSLRLLAQPNDEFIVIGQGGENLGQGSFGGPFSHDQFSFKVSKLDNDNLNNNEYTVLLLPLTQVANAMTKKFAIELDKIDKSLIKITHKFRDRNQASDNVNTLMALYQKHAKKEHEKLCGLQFDYLLSRQKAMGQHLEDMMDAHAKELSSDLSNTGFSTSEKAIEFLAISQQELKRKIFNIDLEIQRLENAQQDPTFDGELFSSSNGSNIFSKISAERRQLKQQSDSLNLAVRDSQEGSKDFHESFASQLNDLDECSQFIKESSVMLVDLEHNMVPQRYPKLVDNPKFIVKEWYGRLVAAKDNFDKNATSTEAYEDWQRCKEGFISYLSHINHYLSVLQRNIKERLAHQQVPNTEFQGITLGIAKDLYIAYAKELSEMESQATQHDFIIGQMDEPGFEISSLSALLSDQVSSNMISTTSNLIISLKDHENRSSKEQERLLSDLAIQKKFLKNHVEQSSSLLKLHQQFLKDKIKQLQSVHFSLVHEQLSILENQLKEYLINALENLHQERALLMQNLAELKGEMATYPQKWTAEHLITHQMEVNKSLVEEISKLVESKNISNNLEKSQSAPIDLSYPPIHPKSPRLILLALIGAFAGAFLSFMWALGASIVHGIEASQDNIRALGLHVSGTISRQYLGTSDKEPLLDSDLDTLRRLIAHIMPAGYAKAPRDGGQTLLLIEGNTLSIASPLADLMVRKGLKAMVVDIRFDKSIAAETPGMLQFLEAKTAKPAIINENGYDYIAPGGICRYANELIGSTKFKEFISNLQKQYDWVIIDSSAMPQSAEAESLLEMFPNAVISVSNETMPELRIALAQAKNPDSKISFLFVGPNHI